MNNLSTQPYKGTRDFYPVDLRLQKYIYGVWRKVSELYGYEEYDAPLIEPLELYLAKSGSEIVNEQTYAFEDRGGRQVTIRPEMTPTVSRMVAARRQELGYPLRLFSIPNVWRYERPQKGRLREHWQWNVDLFGVGGLEAEIELISMSRDVMKAFGATPDMYKISVNSRKLTHVIMNDYLALDEIQAEQMIKLLDRYHKLPAESFEASANEIFGGSADEKLPKLNQLLTVKNLETLPDELKNREEIRAIQTVLSRLQDRTITNAVFDVSLMRGFDYYTDIVFEIADTNPENSRSMFGGGRYDGLVGLFGVDPVPTVGFGMGDVVIKDFLETHHLLPNLQTETDAYIVVIGDAVAGADRLANHLRGEGVTVAVDYSGKKIDAQIKNALNKGIPYAIFVGEQEVTEQQFNLKHLPTNQEERHAPDRIAAMILDGRRQKN